MAGDWRHLPGLVSACANRNLRRRQDRRCSQACGDQAVAGLAGGHRDLQMVLHRAAFRSVSLVGQWSGSVETGLVDRLLRDERCHGFGESNAFKPFED